MGHQLRVRLSAVTHLSGRFHTTRLLTFAIGCAVIFVISLLSVGFWNAKKHIEPYYR